MGAGGSGGGGSGGPPSGRGGAAAEGGGAASGGGRGGGIASGGPRAPAGPARLHRALTDRGSAAPGGSGVAGGAAARGAVYSAGSIPPLPGASSGGGSGGGGGGGSDLPPRRPSNLVSGLRGATGAWARRRLPGPPLSRTPGRPHRARRRPPAERRRCPGAPVLLRRPPRRLSAAPGAPVVDVVGPATRAAGLLLLWRRQRERVGPGDPPSLWDPLLGCGGVVRRSPAARDGDVVVRGGRRPRGVLGGHGRPGSCGANCCAQELGARAVRVDIWRRLR